MDEVSKKAKDLLAECYEQGYPAFVGIANNESGQSIGTANGQTSDVLLLVATWFIRMEDQTGYAAEDMAQKVAKTVKRLKKAGY